MQRGADTGLAVAASVVIAWLWGLLFPETEMPQEVAASIGAIVGPFIQDLRNLRRSLIQRWTGQSEQTDGTIS